MERCELVGQKVATDLTIPEFGRAYLKAALNQNDEKVLLRALDEIKKSFLEVEPGENQDKLL